MYNKINTPPSFAGTCECRLSSMFLEVLLASFSITQWLTIDKLAIWLATLACRLIVKYMTVYSITLKLDRTDLLTLLGEEWVTAISNWTRKQFIVIVIILIVPILSVKILSKAGRRKFVYTTIIHYYPCHFVEILQWREMLFIDQQPPAIFISSLLIKMSFVPTGLTFSFLSSLFSSATFMSLGFLLLQTVTWLWVKTCASNMLSSAKRSPQRVHAHHSVCTTGV